MPFRCWRSATRISRSRAASSRQAERRFGRSPRLAGRRDVHRASRGRSGFTAGILRLVASHDDARGLNPMRPTLTESGSGRLRDARPASVLIGREDVLEPLHQLLADAEERSGGAMIVRGRAGIGKTALIEAVRARADERGLRTLIATGVPSEANLPFAGLHQLLQPLLDNLDSLPGPQREALEAAFGRSDTAEPDLFRIALAALELLGDAAAETPLLLIAEDATWLDGSTSDVLGFIARRLRSDPIVLLLAVRDEEGDAFTHTTLPEIVLAPLDDV